MTKEQLKDKASLKQLASKLGFQSVMFADEFQYSNREDLRYLLWMVELTKWIYETYPETKPLVISVTQPELLTTQLLSLLTIIDLTYGTNN